MNSIAYSLSLLRPQSAILVLGLTLASPVEARQTLDFPAPATAAPIFDGNVAFEDLDHDGYVDAAYGEPNGTVSVRRGDGRGHFGASSTVQTAFSRDVHLVDLDGDGELDLLSTQSPNHELAAALGDGLGGFGPPLFSTLPLIWTMTALAVGDMNGDGDADAVVYSRTPPTFVVALGDGAGHFWAPDRYAWPRMIDDIELGDFDADGNLDIVISEASGLPTAVTVLFGDGAGGWTNKVIATSYGHGLQMGALALGDFDANGTLDIAHPAFDASGWEHVAVVPGDGAGGFGGSITSDFPGNFLQSNTLLARDFDGDGKLDIAFADAERNALVLARDLGDATFAEWRVLSHGNPVYCAEDADVDGDGDADVVTYGVNGLVSFVRDYQQNFGQPLSFGALEKRLDLLVLDVNGDARPDLVSALFDDARLEVYLGTGAGNFYGPSSFPVGAGPVALENGDFDGDGDEDLLSVDRGAGSLSLLSNLGGGAFAPAGTYVLTAIPNDVNDATLADFDGDGDLDVAVTIQSTETFAILLGDGAGALGAPTYYPASTVPSRLESADIDHDGDVDVITTSRLGQFLAVSRNDGTGHFTAPVLQLSGVLQVSSIEAGLLNADLHVDLVCTEDNGARLSVLLNDGHGIFGVNNVLQTPYVPYDAEIADYDSDGIVDVGLVSGSQNLVLLLRGDGLAGFTEMARVVLPGDHMIGFAGADFDGDGKRDVAGVSYLTGSPAFGGGVTVSLQRATPNCAPFASYCTAKTNSLGCTPTLAATGAPSASSPSGFRIVATDVLAKKTGLFFYGTSGQVAAAFQGGTLCVKGPITRTALQNSGGNLAPTDCSGSYEFDFNTHVASGVDPSLVAGTHVDGQFWSRDPGFSAPNNTGLTRAIDFTLCP
ncbi:MAG: VCBS repeat-containing protein [Planctomycetes bacterium]|nr:VCBS repeat-containing protein [Planctomycetota bacterium]